MTPTELKNKFISIYKDYPKDAFSDVRESALLEFEKLGFPNLKNEEWKFTDITNVITHDYNVTEKADLDVDFFNAVALDYPNSNILFFINGKYSEDFSKIISKELEISKIENNEQLNSSKIENNALYSLNTALFTDGITISIGKNISINEPIVIYNIAVAKNNNIANFTKNQILLGKGSSATVIDTYNALGERFAFENNSIEITLDENSKLDLYKIQNEKENSFYYGITNVIQKRDSSFNAVTISLCDGFVRNEINAEFSDINCENRLNGFFLCLKQSLIDNKTFVDHAKPHCFSEELYKGIIGDSARGVFNGKILVRKDAQKTNAFQTNKNILLTDTAEIKTKPQLEIYADDVKCSHGATTGQLDQDALFYLRARGIDKKSALILLLNAFAQDVINNIKIDWLKNRIENLVFEKLNID